MEFQNESESKNLVELPYLVLDEIVSYLDRDEVAYCRQVNRFFRGFIDYHRLHYPLPPVSITITCNPLASNIFTIEKTSDWTGFKQKAIFAQTSESRSDNEGDDYSSIVDSFLLNESGVTECYAVTSFEHTFRELFTGIFEENDISSLTLTEVSTDVCSGIANCLKRPRQIVPEMTISPQEDDEVSPALQLIEWLTPTELTLHNFDLKDMVTILNTPSIQSAKSLIFDFDEHEANINCAPEVFLKLKCEQLDLQQNTGLTSTVVNLLIKEWCHYERNFAEDNGWEVYAINAFNVEEVFSGISCQSIYTKSPRTSIPPLTYYRVCRGSESLTIFAKGHCLLINHPVNYMLSMGSVF